MTQNNKGLVRTSASLPAKVLEDLDQLVIDRGFNNRSALLAEMIQRKSRRIAKTTPMKSWPAP